MRRLRIMASFAVPPSRRTGAVFRGPVDAHHVGSEIPQDHRGMWAGPDASQLDNAQSLQGSSHGVPTFRPL